MFGPCPAACFAVRPVFSFNVVVVTRSCPTTAPDAATWHSIQNIVDRDVPRLVSDFPPCCKKRERERKKVSERGNILSDELLTQNMMHALLSEFYGIYVLDSNETDIIHDDYENV